MPDQNQQEDQKARIEASDLKESVSNNSLIPIREPEKPAKEVKIKTKAGRKASKPCENSSYDDSLDYTYDQLGRLTNKKKEYLQEVIEDKNGVFNFLEDPDEYKRARKYDIHVINHFLGVCKTERVL